DVQRHRRETSRGYVGGRRMKDRGGGKTPDARQKMRGDERAEADRLAWQKGCRANYQLTKGCPDSPLGPVSPADIAARYGRFLGFLKRIGRLDLNAPAASQVTLANVESYMADFTGKVTSVTAWNCIYKLRRAAQLLSPTEDFTWLTEIEKDLELLQEPRSKFDRLVMTEQFVEVGLSLITEAKAITKARIKRARGIRNGLMVALLALCPSRKKNFAALEIDRTIRQVKG